ncbi:hypothetical protein, partial [Sinorhizobium medicae]|uniref:hypothetical protein n=1 Tax=Sinorhizobium medicae TaxID=110321 RepID=UPI002B1BE0AC
GDQFEIGEAGGFDPLPPFCSGLQPPDRVGVLQEPLRSEKPADKLSTSESKMNVEPIDLRRAAFLGICLV